MPAVQVLVVWVVTWLFKSTGWVSLFSQQEEQKSKCWWWTDRASIGGVWRPLRHKLFGLDQLVSSLQHPASVVASFGWVKKVQSPSAQCSCAEQPSSQENPLHSHCNTVMAACLTWSWLGVCGGRIPSLHPHQDGQVRPERWKRLKNKKYSHIWVCDWKCLIVKYCSPWDVPCQNIWLNLLTFKNKNPPCWLNGKNLKHGFQLISPKCFFLL